MEEEPDSNNKYFKKRKLNKKAFKFHGPVFNLEEYVQPNWWQEVFNSTYLKTDADVVDDPKITKKEVDSFLSILKLSSEDKILDLCCGHGRHTLEIARSGFKNVEGLDRSHI